MMWVGSNGELLEYTAYVNNAGLYNLKLRVASLQSSNKPANPLWGTT